MGMEMKKKKKEDDDVVCIGHRDGFSLGGMEKISKANCAKRKEIYKPQDFALGDIVWAKCGKSYPAWPAVVIDPILQAPRSVLSCCVPGALCVMLYGFSNSKTRTQRDYGWVKQGMIFPFTLFLDRFLGQTRLYKSKPSDFQMAIDEALLAENGVVDTSFGNHRTNISEANLAQFQDSQACDCCGLLTPSESMERRKGSRSEPQLLCTHCAKLENPYCGICQKIWHHSDGGNWVCCDGCNVWLHAECDQISSKVFKVLEHIDYYCPDCKAKFKRGSSGLVKRQQKASSTQSKSLISEQITVVCNGMEGTYFPKFQMVVCKCGFCGSKKQTPGEWEKHTGCRTKKWKNTVKVKSTMRPLGKWIANNDKHRLGLDKWRLLDFMQEEYEPVNTEWTTERCVVCRWVEDWEDNKIIICSRCQIAVHQQCYGAKDVQDFTFWVCRACETPDVVRQCCLCPVRGGALKPTDVDTLWVHVSCAWFRPEVGFVNPDKMEPAVGILNIPPTTFLERCVICKQIHGSCTKCCRCTTYFHTMCASRAGYNMQVHNVEKNGVQRTRKLIFCSAHRTPNPDTGVLVGTPLRHIRKGYLRAARVVPPERTELPEPSRISKEVEDSGISADLDPMAHGSESLQACSPSPSGSQSFAGEYALHASALTKTRAIGDSGDPIEVVDQPDTGAAPEVTNDTGVAEREGKRLINTPSKPVGSTRADEATNEGILNACLHLHEVRVDAAAELLIAEKVVKAGIDEELLNEPLSSILLDWTAALA